MKVLSTFSLIMITVGSVDSIRNLPTIALFGSSLIFFFLLATIFFLIPSSLITAELAATWPESGGVYTWVKYAFGKRMGFAAIWFQWISTVIWYPTILSFAAATVGYLISPSLINNKWFLIAAILFAFWGVTIVNLLGMRLSALVGSVCTIFGLLLPVLLMILLGFKWFFSGNSSQIDLNYRSLLPNLHDPALWVSLTGIIMSFCGMEVATIHAEEVRNPHKAFPIALLVAMIILFFTLSLGALAVAIVLPGQQINLAAGVMQAFQAFFVTYHLQMIIPFVAMLIVLGSLGGVNNWTIAPTKGLSIAAKDGHLPLHFAKKNKYSAPHILLLYQAIMVTLFVLVFVFMPNVNASYWFLTVLAAQLYMLMYIILFAAAIRLRLMHPHKHKPRPFRIPGKDIGICVIAIAGIIGAFAAFAVGFIPPNVAGMKSIFQYDIMLLSGLFLMSLPPFVIYHLYAKKKI